MGKIIEKIQKGFQKVIGLKQIRKEITALKNQQDELLQLQRESLKSMLFLNTIMESGWLKNKSFSPGGWAVDYGFLYTLYRVLNDMKPKNIIEFGLGQTSKMLYQYQKAYPKTQVCTIEHNQEWIEFFQNEVNGDYEPNVIRLDLETINYKGYETLTYRELAKVTENNKYDLIVVDGPYGSDHYARTQLIDLLDNLSDSFCIILDDYERVGEQETIKEVEAKLHSKHVDYKLAVYSASKQHIVICSPNNEFLTTLYWF